MTKLSPQELKRRHQEKMVKDLVKTSDKWMKEHGINLKDIPPDEPLAYNRKSTVFTKEIDKTVDLEQEKPIVKYHHNKKTGIRYKHTLLATIRGNEARALHERHMDRMMYWSYDAKKNILEIYEEKMLTPLD